MEVILVQEFTKKMLIFFIKVIINMFVEKNKVKDKSIRINLTKHKAWDLK